MGKVLIFQANTFWAFITSNFYFNSSYNLKKSFEKQTIESEEEVVEQQMAKKTKDATVSTTRRLKNEKYTISGKSDSEVLAKEGEEVKNKKKKRNKQKKKRKVKKKKKKKKKRR